MSSQRTHLLHLPGEGFALRVLRRGHYTPSPDESVSESLLTHTSKMTVGLECRCFHAPLL